MTREQYYILATNLTKLRIINTILRDVLVMNDDPVMKENDWRAMVIQILEWTDGLYTVIDGAIVVDERAES